MHLCKIAAGVILYRPDSNVLLNISTYYDSIDFFIVIDNSEIPNHFFQKELYMLFPCVNYHFLKRNAGIATALNIACNIATQNNCSWILTMDQDSSFKGNQLLKMIDGIPNVKLKFPQAGIISPFHVLYENNVPKVPNRYSVKKIVMTSGNLLNLDAYATTGPFEEKLFMDYVDYEYCLRLTKNNYNIIQDNLVYLKHSLGDFKIKKLFSQKIGVSNHNSVRRYYMTRNSLYVGFKYFKTEKVFFLNMLKNVLFWDPFIILIYEKDKLAKLKSIYRGFSHFIFKKYGKAVPQKNI